MNRGSVSSGLYASQQCSRLQCHIGTGIMHAHLSPCHLPQACIPLSYAAQIPTTPNRDLANVRVSLSNMEPEVCQCSVHYLVSLCGIRCM